MIVKIQISLHITKILILRIQNQLINLNTLIIVILAKEDLTRNIAMIIVNLKMKNISIIKIKILNIKNTKDKHRIQIILITIVTKSIFQKIHLIKNNEKIL